MDVVSARCSSAACLGSRRLLKAALGRRFDGHIKIPRASASVPCLVLFVREQRGINKILMREHGSKSLSKKKVCLVNSFSKAGRAAPVLATRSSPSLLWRQPVRGTILLID